MRRVALFVVCSLLLVGCGDTLTAPSDADAPQFAVAANPPAAGLIGHWMLDGDPADAGPYALGGSTEGSVTPTVDPDGTANGAMLFSGGSHIKIPHDAGLNVADFTISFWVNPTQTGTLQNIITKGRDGLNGYEFRYGATGELSLDVVNGSRWAGDPIVGLVKTPVPAGSWHHVTGVLNNTELKISLYVDGILAAEEDLLEAYTTNNTYPLVFGRHYTAADGSLGWWYSFTGALDDVRVYNRVLSDSEIDGLQPLDTHWMLNGDAMDAGPNGLSGSILGAVTPTMDREGAANGAMLFSGGSHIKIPHDAGLNVADFTISFWVNPTQTGTLQNIITKGRDGLNGYEFRYGATGELSLDVVNGSRWAGDPIVGLVKTPVPAGSWHHVTGVLNNTELKISLYVDGWRVAEEDLLEPYETNNTYPLVFGRHYTAADGSLGWWYSFTGALDDVRMSGRALSISELGAQVPQPAVLAELAGDEILEGTTFTESGSFQDDGGPHTWSATVDYGDGDGQEGLSLDGNTFDLSHTYATPGTFTVTVRVTDNWGNESVESADVHVVHPQPAVLAELAGGEILEGETFTESGSFQEDGWPHTWSATADYGDGDGEEGLGLDGNTFDLSHSYATSGTFTVTVRVTDNWGNESEAMATVIVLAPSAAAVQLEASIDVLVSQGGVDPSSQSALETSLAAAQESYSSGNPVAGNNQMGAFINKVEAGMRSGKISAEAGSVLVAQAERIKASGAKQTKNVGKKGGG